MPPCKVVTQRRFEFQLGMFAVSTAMFFPVLSQLRRCVFVHNRQPPGVVTTTRHLDTVEMNKRLLYVERKSYAMQALRKSL